MIRAFFSALALAAFAVGCAAPQQENPTGYDVQMERRSQENFNETLNPNM